MAWIDLKTSALADTVYVDGTLVAKEVAFTLPEIVPLTVEYRTTGTAELPLLGMIESMEASVTKIGIDYGFLALARPTAQTYEFRWKQEVRKSDGNAPTELCKAFLRGMAKTIPGPSIDPGNAIENEFTLAVVRYQLMVGGAEFCLIDQLNHICRLRGIDYAKDVYYGL